MFEKLSPVILSPSIFEDALSSLIMDWLKTCDYNLTLPFEAVCPKNVKSFIDCALFIFVKLLPLKLAILKCLVDIKVPYSSSGIPASLI
jgi:hypothetical protein